MQRLVVRHYLLIIFVSALLVRVGFYYLFLANNPIVLAYDCGQYHAVAQQLANGLGFINPDGSPHLYRLPGYPLFLALCYRLLGWGYHGALAVQVVLASCIPVLGFYLARLLLPQVALVPYVVAGVLTIHPGLLIFSGLVMSETLFLLMFLLFLLLYVRLLQRPAQYWYAACGAGVVFGLASLIRPVGLPLIIVLLVGLLWRCLRIKLSDDPHGSIRWPLVLSAREARVSKDRPALTTSRSLYTLIFRIGISIGLLVGWLAVVGYWVLRNALLTGVWCLHTLTGPHLLNHGAARVVAAAAPCSYVQAQKVVQQQLGHALAQAKQQRGHELSSPEVCQVMEALAVHTLWQHPWQAVKLGAVNVTKTVLSLYSSELLCIDAGGALPSYDPGRGWSAAIKRFVAPTVHNRWIVWVIYSEILLHLLLLFGCIGYGYQLARGRWPLVPSLLMLSLIALFVALSCLCGFARLRLPIEPFLVVMAAAFYTSSKTT
jgi:hypothetical protein